MVVVVDVARLVETGDGETGEPDYVPCDCEGPVNLSWKCDCEQYSNGDWSHKGYFCGFEANAADLCEMECPEPFWTDTRVTQAVCGEQESELNCAAWDPASEVSRGGSGEYVLSWPFVWQLFSDPEPLWGCDDAIVVLGEDGFEIANADRGELLYELGLRNGDIIKSINGRNLDTYEDVGAAISELWFTSGTTQYTLEIERDTLPVELDYWLFVSQ